MWKTPFANVITYYVCIQCIAGGQRSKSAHASPVVDDRDDSDDDHKPVAKVNRRLSDITSPTLLSDDDEDTAVVKKRDFTQVCV